MLTALIAAFSTSQPASREAEAREEKRARRCEKSGTRALSLQRAVWIVDGTPINYSSHIKNHSDLFFTWPFSLLRPVDNQDGSRIFLNFIYFKTRFDTNYSKVNLNRDRMSNILSSFEISLDFLFLKTFFLPLLEGYFIISLVEIKLEMKLDKSCAGYEKLRDYVSSLG